MKKKNAATPNNMKSTILRLLGYLKPYRFHMTVIVVSIVISSVTNAMAISFIEPMVDDYIKPIAGTANPDFAGINSMLVKMAVVFILNGLASYVTQRVILPASTGVLRQLRVDTFSHMQTLPLRFFDSTPHGELMNYFTNDIDAVREMMSTSIIEVLSSLITIVALFINMIRLSWHMTIVMVVLLFLMTRFTGFIGKHSRGYFVRQQQVMADTNGYLEEYIEGQNVIKVFNHEKEAIKGFDELNNKLEKESLGANTMGSILFPIVMNLGNLNYAIMAIIGSVLSITLDSSIGLGTIIAFLTSVRNLNQPIAQVSQQFNSVLRALSGAERVFAIMDMQPEKDDGTVTLVNVNVKDGQITESEKTTGQWAWKEVLDDETNYVMQQGEIIFENVFFGYNKDKMVLKDISLYANSGQKVALVGSTGAGKTTITNLINRFYDITSGAIYYDGIDIRNIKKDDLRQSFSMVLQDTHLFTGTISDNIRYGNLDASDQKVIEAAKIANADSFIKHLPRQYDTHLTGSGGNLSQGQRQLLSIARVAVSNPPALILDEATSSIDTRTEAAVGRGMDSLMNNRTSFVIAHRLSTIRDSDVIIVLENGQIIEKGSHDQLLEQKERYYQLYTGAIELS